MKIVWALPDFAEAKTGGEKFYVKLRESLAGRAEIIYPKGLEFFRPKNIAEQVKANINNFKILSALDSDALIFQGLYFRISFFLANIALSVLHKRKIVMFVNEDYSVPERMQLIKKIVIMALYHLCFQFVYRINVLSKSSAGWVCKFGNFKKKIFVYYPILNDLLAGRTSKISVKNGDVKQLLCVANIRRDKGQEYLIEAINILKRKDLKLNFVGLVKEEPYYSHLLRKIEQSGLVGRIKFSGFLRGEELAAVYGDADIFILPTLREAFGMVLIEAMSFGLPVIASNVGGVPEIIQNGVDGLLIPPASLKDLVCAINKVSEDGVLRQRLAKNALNKYRRMPTWGRSLEDFCEFIS